MSNNDYLLNFTFLFKKRYLIKEGTFVGKCEKFTLYSILVIAALLLGLNKFYMESKPTVNIMFWGCILMFGIPILLYIVHYQKIKKILKSGEGEIFSKNTNRSFKILPKATIIYCLIFFTGTIISVLNIRSSNIDFLRLRILIFLEILGLCLIAIKAFLIDRIIVFKNVTFISGLDEVKYNKISSAIEYKRFTGIPEDLIVIKFIYNGECVGFDKLLESDFNYLHKKITETNSEVK